MSAAVAAGRLTFSKMHGAGNDMLVVDGRLPQWRALLDDPSVIVRLCDRRRGIGCDQLMVLEQAADDAAAFGYRVFNADGSSARQCGNGVRCLAAWMERAGLAQAPFTLASPSGPVAVRRARLQGAARGVGIDDATHSVRTGELAVSLGEPDFTPSALPFDASTGQSLQFDGTEFHFDVVSMGNPHAVLLVDELDRTPVAAIAAALQADPRFADGCNVGIVQVLDRQRARLRVVERGVGETLACGSGACAAAAVLLRRGLVDSPLALALPGGTLCVDWEGPGHPAWLSGPVAFVFDGEWHP